MDNSEFFVRVPDPLACMAVRCWVRSREPTTTLFEYLQKRIAENTKLTVVEIRADAGKDRQSWRRKRPLSTIDLDPRVMQDIIDDIWLFLSQRLPNSVQN
jgi:hypothetical protein